MSQRSERFLIATQCCIATCLLAALGVTATAAADTETYLTYSGTATSLRTDKFLYRENHILQYRDGKMAGRVVLYTCRDGSAFARKTVSYVEPLSPDFLLEDASNGMREGIRTEGDVRRVFFRGDRVAAERSSAMPPLKDLVADSGFDVFVRTHWQSLLDGRVLGMNFLVPSRLEDMGFKVQHVGSTEIHGMPVEMFRLKLSGVLGWVAPSIDVYYSASERTLVRYVGLSDLRDASSENFQADINFRPSDQKAADPEAMSTALHARLAPCK